MPLWKLPPTVDAFLRAVQANDAAALAAALHQEAVVIDADRKHRAGAIQTWAVHFFQAQGHTVRPINQHRQNGEIMLTVMAGRGKYPAFDVQFDWQFRMEAGQIVEVQIEPHKTLPAPVAAYVRATNSWDLEVLLATFADDALVNDQLQDYWGKQQIRDWAAKDIIGERLTMDVTKCVEHYSNVIITANVNGNFDKRGLPDPLVLTFYFSAPGDKIVQLIILRNHLGT